MRLIGLFGIALFAAACAAATSSSGDGGLPDGGGGGDFAVTNDALEGDLAGGDAARPPLHGIFNVRDHAAAGDCTTDDTAAIRATIMAAATAGGGIVELPAGCYRITGNLSVPTAVTLAGVGFTPPPAGTTPAKLAGSWLIVDANFLNAPAITLTDAGATARDLGIWHEQPTPGAGWQPRAFGWAVDMPASDTLARNLWLENPTLGIHGIGRVTVENVQGEPITTGIQIEYAYDVVRIRRVRFNWTADGGPVWSADPSVTARLGVAVESLRDDNPEVNDVKVSGYATGFHFGANVASGANPAGATSKFSLMDIAVSNAGRCLTVDGANTTGKLARFAGNQCGVTGVWLNAPNAVVSAADLDLRGMTGNAIRVEASGAAMLVNQLTVVNWNTSGAGFPAVEAADANATVKVGFFTSYMGGGTAATVGGVGKSSVDTNSADTAFDLRIAAPTAIPEDGLEPFDARADVLAYGAAGDGKTDDTAALQAGLDATAAAGGGTLLVPAGNYLVKGGLKVPSGVALVGVGWNAVGDKGARLYVDAADTSDVITLSDGASLRQLGMHWDQGTVGNGWQPRQSFGWGVRVSGTNVVVRDVFMLNPTRGLIVSSTGAGPVLIDRLAGSPNQVGLAVDTNAALRVNDVHFWPFWGVCAGSPPSGCQPGTFAYQVNTPKEASGVAFELDHSAHAELSNAFSIGYAVGVALGKNAAGQVNTDLRMWNADQDIFGARGYQVSGPGTQATFANWSCQGDNGSDVAITGLWTESSATGAQIAGYNGDLRIFGANAIRAEGTSASIKVNLMRLDSFNLSGAGFPAVEGAGGTAASGPESWINGQ